MTFLDAVLAGEVQPSEIDDYVDRWHRSDVRMSLEAYLGFTEEEYRNWVASPQVLEHIIAIQRLVRASAIALEHEIARRSDRLN